MNILVTGGAGFIGSNFIHYWLSKYPKDKIVNLDNLTYAGHPESLKDIENSPRYSFVKGDICDSMLVDKLVSETDLIIHFAAETHVDRSVLDPLVFVKTNILGTQTLLEAAKKYSIRFHHISTDEVFGTLPLDTNEKFSEKTPYDPRSPYSASKASSDHLVRAYFHTFGLPITITNCSNNFGPFQDTEKFLPRMITNLIIGDKVKIYGDGLYVRDWLYVEDHCSAIDAVISKGVLGETYCVGGLVKDYSNLDITKKILKYMGKDETSIEYVKDRPGHDRRYAVDWSRINKSLGWSPSADFEVRLEETVNWYKENESWWKPLKEKSESIYKYDMGFIKTNNSNIKLPTPATLLRQTYDKASLIDGVIIVKTNTFPDDFGGWFKEAVRLDQGGRVISMLDQNIIFKPVQTNTSFLAPNTKRFWHIHPNQNEIWTTSGTLLIGLIDLRSGSKTYGVKMKVILSTDRFLYIPAGVAHGFINPNSSPVVLSYYTDQYFTADDSTQEYRISPKKISYEFVKPELM